MRRVLLPVCLLITATLCPWTSSMAEVKVGETQAVQARAGLTVRGEPRAMSKQVGTLQYGDQIKIVEVRENWVRIAGVNKLDGWVRASDLVAPAALTGAVSYAGAVASADVTAAGRQFDQKTENTYRSMDAEIAKAFPKVDYIEKDKPTEETVMAFLRAGVLGGTATDPEGSSGNKYAKLKLLASNGKPDVDNGLADVFVPPARAMNDAEFVERMGMGFSPEQEYWLGRSVAAAAIAEHGLDPDPKHQELVQKIGASIVRCADRLRATHGGYHFAVLNDPTPNGISGPGGFVLITKGALQMARNEDEIAGILAHEMAHISHKHGEAMVRKNRDFQDALKALEDKIKTPSKGPDGCNICADMARALGVSAKSIVKTLDQEGYGKDFELEADWDGSLYLCEVGYRASAIAEYLELLPTREASRWTTHPSSEDRIENLRPLVFKHGCPFDTDTGAQARMPRFRALELAAISK